MTAASRTDGQLGTPSSGALLQPRSDPTVFLSAATPGMRHDSCVTVTSQLHHGDSGRRSPSPVTPVRLVTARTEPEQGVIH